MINRIKSFCLVSLVITLSACTSQPGRIGPGTSEPAKLNATNLYLRGSFNWWGTIVAHQLKQGSKSNIWFADVELIADGQPHDFKLSDAVWTPDQTCGAASITELQLDKTVPLYCLPGASNIRFAAPENGTYRFIVKEASSRNYEIWVRQL